MIVPPSGDGSAVARQGGHQIGSGNCVLGARDIGEVDPERVNPLPPLRVGRGLRLQGLPLAETAVGRHAREGAARGRGPARDQVFRDRGSRRLGHGGSIARMFILRSYTVRICNSSRKFRKYRREAGRHGERKSASRAICRALPARTGKREYAKPLRTFDFPAMARSARPSRKFSARWLTRARAAFKEPDPDCVLGPGAAIARVGPFAFEDILAWAGLHRTPRLAKPPQGAARRRSGRHGA